MVRNIVLQKSFPIRFAFSENMRYSSPCSEATTLTGEEAMYRLIVHNGPLTIVDVTGSNLMLMHAINDRITARWCGPCPTRDFYTDADAVGEWSGINPNTGEPTGKSILKGRDRCSV
jgi:hypothetical protein